MIWTFIATRIIVPFLPWIIGGLITAGGVGTIGGYIKGRLDANASCQEASLRVELATLKRDMVAWRLANDIEKSLQADLEAELSELERKVQDYEREVEKRPGDRCRLTPDDVRALDGLRGDRER